MNVFVFPLLNVSLFPRMTKPLNIFEGRYVRMIKDSVAENIPISLGFVDDPASLKDPQIEKGQTLNFVRPIMGFGYGQIIEERSNGSILFFLTGAGKLRLGKTLDWGRPYFVCESEPIQENLNLNPKLQTEVKILNKILARWIHTHISDPQQQDHFLRNLIGPVEIVSAFATYMVKDFDFQQEILEEDDINEKIRLLFGLAQSSELNI